MIQVIQRAFTLLFAIAEEPQKVHGISELAELIHVQPSTCFHIVNSMLELGVVERVGKRKGYRLGPAVMKICRNNLYRPELVWKADPLFRAFAAEYRVKIELIVLQGKRRYILCHAEPEHTLRVDYNPLSCEDVLVTPSGKLLLAHAPEEVQKELYNQLQGTELPQNAKDLWPEHLTLETYLQELKEFRKNHVFIREKGGQVVVLFPLYGKDSSVIAAIASIIPAYLFKNPFQDQVVRAPYQISSALSGIF